MRTLLSAVALAAFATPALAAEDGALGATSNGNFFVSAEVVGEEPVAQVSSLADFTFGPIARGDGARRLADTICVYHTSPTVQLSIIQDSRTSFALLGPNGAELPFDIVLFDFIPGGERRFSQAINETGIIGNRTTTDCNDAPQVLFVDLPAVPQDQPFGAYSAQISVIVAVE